MSQFLPIEIMIAYMVELLGGDTVESKIERSETSPHPVRIIGKAIIFLEQKLRQLWIPERISGAILTFTIVTGTYLTTYLITSVLGELHGTVEVIVGTIILYYTFSVRGLAVEAQSVLRALEAGDIDKARSNLSRIVGRDTKRLNEEQIIRACIESVAENTVDGFFSPLFYAAIGGPPLAMAYKAVNTLDSMVGYKNEKYLKFGWASARLDDLANYIPARIAARFLPFAAYFCGTNFQKSFYIIIRNGRKHPSPNSGIPEAAYAGALGVQLGGPSTYNGELCDKPFIGDDLEPLTTEKLRVAIKILYAASIIAVASACTVLTIARLVKH
ncbi:MAG: cobalamin biosynthesis protein CobD [Planctomycetes bacterium]|nr:cobalamin biosynthesis protein CobD [Planctomycetota bacterium]